MLLVLFSSVEPRPYTYEEIKVRYENLNCHKKFSLRYPHYDVSAKAHSLRQEWTTQSLRVTTNTYNDNI